MAEIGTARKAQLTYREKSLCFEKFHFFSQRKSTFSRDVHRHSIFHRKFAKVVDYTAADIREINKVVDIGYSRDKWGVFAYRKDSAKCEEEYHENFSSLYC